MSKKQKNQEIEDAVIIEEVEGRGPAELGCLMDTILDYFCATGEPPLVEGDEWKEGTEYRPKGLSIPKEVDDEVKKAFIFQLKKFQE